MIRKAISALAAVAMATGIAGAAQARDMSKVGDSSQIQVSPQLPYDAQVQGLTNYQDLRNAYNTWSWNTFIALNWPALAGQRGVPDTSAGIGGSGARVWETYKTSAETFPTPPTLPTAWENLSSPPSGCPQRGPGILLTRAGKGDDPTLSAVTQPMSGKFGHLIDQNGNYVFIDVGMNKIAYDFIYDNKYYDADVQIAAATNLLFPVVGDNATRQVGPINVKPSWKILAGKDDAGSFYARQAYVIDPDTKVCTAQQVGLVGFHLTAKTTSAPQWIWATFEHKANAPECSYPNGTAGGCTPVWSLPQYNFANQQCQTNCDLNKLPTSATDKTPVQVARIIPIPADVQAMNVQAQALLKGTVWENYVLVDSQFPTNPSALYGQPAPVSLANATLETYNQGTSPNTQTSSCLGCHFLAPTAYQPAGKYFADFDFQLHHAQSYSKAAKAK